jgi:EAL domain-containing protein (putative c-di-GMP-specific phosphodiesterase class I)
VNVSPLQLSDPYFCRTVETALARANLSPQFLELELTESAVMENPAKGIRILNDIHDLGVKISVDDFGTGYSSLSYLKKLPIDHIKVDRSFVSDIGLNSSNESIVQALIAMSHSLDMYVIAEGVESVEQLIFLQANECDLMQGYYFSRPLSTQSVESMFLTQPRPLGDQLQDFHMLLAKENRPTH